MAQKTEFKNPLAGFRSGSEYQTKKNIKRV